MFVKGDHQVRACIFSQVCNYASLIAPKVHGEPVIEAGDYHLAVFQPCTPGMIYEGMGGFVQLLIQFTGLVGPCAQVRAAKRGAIQYVVNPRILPERPQDTMFNIV